MYSALCAHANDHDWYDVTQKVLHASHAYHHDNVAHTRPLVLRARQADLHS
jgi:hypothetical protein